MVDVRTSATRIRDQATEIINLMRVGANAEETVVNTAFQWAQRPDFVYLNVKFSSRIDGPVTCLNVDNEKVTLTNQTLLFEAVGRQKPKTFRLNLTFHGEIDPERSTWSFASVGRISFTIAKVERETWPRLLAGKLKPKNMHSWYDRQTALDAEVKKEKEAAKKAKDEEDARAKKEAERLVEEAKKGAAPGAPPPLPNYGADGPSPPPPVESVAAAEKAKEEGKAEGKKRKVKKGGKKKAKPKDEV